MKNNSRLLKVGDIVFNKGNKRVCLVEDLTEETVSLYVFGPGVQIREQRTSYPFDYVLLAEGAQHTKEEYAR